MPRSRRFFLKSATLAALCAGFALESASFVLAQGPGQSDPSQDFPIPREAQQDLLFSYNRATFEPYVNSIFQAPDALGRMVNLTLLSVTAYKPNPKAKLMPVPARELDSFSLIFRASRRLPAFTSIHKMRHAALGDFDLFLTPRENDGAIFYEAVFSRMR
jgi:Domain of unknown function (DUF6916)